jgi:hypothetical protein
MDPIEKEPHGFQIAGYDPISYLEPLLCRTAVLDLKDTTTLDPVSRSSVLTQGFAWSSQSNMIAVAAAAVVSIPRGLSGHKRTSVHGLCSNPVIFDK